MGRKSKPTPRAERKGKDNGKKFKKKPCIFCKDRIDFVDYKDVNLLRRFMSDRAKIRARRVTGNCAQHQRDVALAIKLSRELALLPYAVRVTSSRGGGRGGRRDDRGGDRPPRDERPPRPGPNDAPPPPGGVEGGDDDVAAGDDALAEVGATTEEA
jgi:small subunit ribosomal protein S18